MVKNNRRLFHYTVGACIESIINDGCIIVAKELVPKNEKPVVWCTYDQNWDETANKSVMDKNTNQIRHLNKKETHEYCGGLFRIEVKPESAKHNWKAFKRLSGIKNKFSKALEITAKRKGSNPADWRGSFSPIYDVDWLMIEKWDGQSWVTIWNPNS